VSEYLAPGVYVEEVSFRSKSILGVPSSAGGALALGVLIGVGLAIFFEEIVRRSACQPPA
jgi:hypothetical protein